jgi:Tfp pilus assembly protein PilO
VKDKLASNIHLIFLVYALMLGMDSYDEMNLKFESAKGALESSTVKLNKIKMDLNKLKRFESNLEESRGRVREVVKRIEKVQKQLPSEIRDADVSGKLTQFSDDLKMLDPSPVPRVEQDFKFYASKDYNFDAKGTFLQFLIFFENLETLGDNGRILNVKYLRFTESNTGDDRSRFKILNLSTTVEAYR